jgi:hypothetical protein
MRTILIFSILFLLGCSHQKDLTYYRLPELQSTSLNRIFFADSISLYKIRYTHQLKDVPNKLNSQPISEAIILNKSQSHILLNLIHDSLVIRTITNIESEISSPPHPLSRSGCFAPGFEALFVRQKKELRLRLCLKCSKIQFVNFAPILEVEEVKLGAEDYSEEYESLDKHVLEHQVYIPQIIHKFEKFLSTFQLKTRLTKP